MKHFKILKGCHNMKKSNSIKRTMSFMLIFSIVYTVFEGNLLFLTPILTVLIPFRFMKNKENTDKNFFDNQKTLTRLLLFNFIPKSYLFSFFHSSNCLCNSTFISSRTESYSFLFNFSKVSSVSTEPVYKGLINSSKALLTADI